MSDREAEAGPDIERRVVGHTHARTFDSHVPYHTVPHVPCSFMPLSLFVRFYSRSPRYGRNQSTRSKCSNCISSSFHREITIVAAQKLPSVCARRGCESKLKSVYRRDDISTAQSVAPFNQRQLHRTSIHLPGKRIALTHIRSSSIKFCFIKFLSFLHD